MSESILSARDLRKVYRLGKHEVAVLKGVNLDVKPGESLQTASLDDTPTFATGFQSRLSLMRFVVPLWRSNADVYGSR